MHVLLFLINFNNFEQIKKKLKVLPSRLIKYFLTNLRIQMVLTDAQKSTEIYCRCESMCKKNVQILIISVPVFRPAHRNFRPAPSNPCKKNDYPHPRLLVATRVK